MQDEVRNKPVQVFACGAVKAAIGADSRVIDNEVVEVHSIKFDRSYKDKGDGPWKHTNAFNAEDLPKVAVVAMEAYKYLRLRSYENEDQNKDNVSNTGG
ncbi:MAG: hypothetical protein NTZ17_11585 [Phycisphaerae bacterium]|nr:hypothetical protein [Phycisphaerae bacterium]